MVNHNKIFAHINGYFLHLLKKVQSDSRKTAQMNFRKQLTAAVLSLHKTEILNSKIQSANGVGGEWLC